MPRGGIDQTYLPRIENNHYSGRVQTQNIPTTASQFMEPQVGPKVIKNPYVK